MELTHEILDVEAYEANKFLPATILPRKPAEHWLVRDLPFGIEGKVSEEWGWTREGEHVRVPLFPYIANGTNPAVALTFAIELALRALSTVSGFVKVLRVHFVIGHPVTERDDIQGTTGPVLRFWLGFGFLVKE